MLLLGTLGILPHAFAQEVPPSLRVKIDVGLGTWISVGETQSSHDASSQPPLGNPTSQLTYEDHTANVIEFTAKVSVGLRWFGRVNAGGASIGGGRLTDDDFLATDGGSPSLETHSDINGAGLFYVNADVGARLANLPNGRGTFNGFVGFQYWWQEHEAFGVRQVTCSNAGATTDLDPATPNLDPLCVPGAAPISNTTLAISNVSKWYSLRTGIQTEYRLTRWLSLQGAAILKPLSFFQNEDTHHLRSDLLDPSFTMSGIGFGADADIGARVNFTRALAGYVGYRVWWNRMIDGTWENHLANGQSFSFPLTEFESLRHGLTAGINYTF
jgi:hypothetical protein